MLKIGDKIKIVDQNYLESDSHLENLIGVIIPDNSGLIQPGEFLAHFEEDMTAAGPNWYVYPEEVEIVQD